MRELTNSVYVGESIIWSHISIVKPKLVVKLPQILNGKIIQMESSWFHASNGIYDVVNIK